jgi:hypothetical protein
VWAQFPFSFCPEVSLVCNTTDLQANFRSSITHQYYLIGTECVAIRDLEVSYSNLGCETDYSWYIYNFLSFLDEDGSTFKQATRGFFHIFPNSFPHTAFLYQQILSRVWVTYRRVLDWVIGFIDTSYIQNSGLQAIQRYRWFTHFTVHCYTRTSVLSLH